MLFFGIWEGMATKAFLPTTLSIPLRRMVESTPLGLLAFFGLKPLIPTRFEDAAGSLCTWVPELGFYLGTAPEQNAGGRAASASSAQFHSFGRM